MSQRNVAWSVAFLLVSLAACDDAFDGPAVETEAIAPDPAGALAAESAATEQGPSSSGPEKTCREIVAAAKASDEGQMLALCIPGSAEALGAAKNKDTVMAALASATCGAATITDDRATVSVTAEQGALDLPFMKVGDAWKFDTATYLAAISPAPPPKRNAKVKKKKGRKKRKKAKRRSPKQ